MIHQILFIYILPKTKKNVIILIIGLVFALKTETFNSLQILS